MRWTNYLLLCVVVAGAVFLTMTYIPSLANTVEAQLLSFLSTNAR